MDYRVNRQKRGMVATDVSTNSERDGEEKVREMSTKRERERKKASPHYFASSWESDFTSSALLRSASF